MKPVRRGRLTPVQISLVSLVCVFSLRGEARSFLDQDLPAVAEQKAVYAAMTGQVIVHLSADVDKTLPVILRPLVPAVRVKRRIPTKVEFEFANLSDRAVDIRAFHRVRPDKATEHLTKLACFCFERQRLAPGEVRVMPVVFTLGPDLPWETDQLVLHYSVFEDSAKGPSS